MSRLTIDQAMQMAIGHLQSRQLGEAEAICRQILTALPNHADCLYMMGVIAGQTGRHESAGDFFRRAIAVHPGNVDYHLNLAMVLEKLGHLDEAVDCCQKAIRITPANPQAYNQLGVYLRRLGQIDQAIASHQRAIELKPDFAWAWNNLGNAWLEKRAFESAISCYEQAIKLDGNNSKFHCGLGNALKESGQADRAVASYELAVKLHGDDVDALVGLAGVHLELGLIDQAISSFRRALEVNPTSVVAHDGLLFAMLHDPHSGLESEFVEKQNWDLQQARPLATLIVPLSCDPNPDRKLRIGYVSPDFRAHPAGLFAVPLFAMHDQNQIENFCYSQVRQVDQQTKWFENRAAGWRNILGRSDDEVARQIREDRIDILVDIAMHSAGNRLLVFARKPAPVQVTYLAYAGGTGLANMDYRLTDRYLDPDESNDRYYMEKSIRLSGTYWCWHESPVAGDVAETPAIKNGHLTFGCLNKFSKISAPAMQAWADILNRAADSRLILHAKPGQHRDRVIGFFLGRGIARERIEFVPFKSTADYLSTYSRIDIALDPFPYNGGTTTCDALWMGAAVITLEGAAAVSRAGVSILSNAGLPELIAQDVEEYIRKAIDLAGDLNRLKQLRISMRDRLRQSPLMDAVAYTRSIENAYRTMWRSWCAKQ